MSARPETTTPRTQPEPASQRFVQLPEISLYSARLNRTLVLCRYNGRVHVYLYAGRKTVCQPPLAAGIDALGEPVVLGLDRPDMQPWLDVGFNAYTLDDRAEAHAIAIWLEAGEGAVPPQQAAAS